MNGILQRATVFAATLHSMLGIATAARPEAGEHQIRAAELVQDALHAELQGDVTRRAQLLAEARVARPSYEAARWHSGQVLFDGQWKSIDDVAAIVSGDSRWQDYRQLRDTVGDTAVDHSRLAGWCARRGLKHEERYHWTMVLLHDWTNAEARSRLDLREYRDGLYTAEQIKQLEQQAAEAKKDLAGFRPKLVAIRRRAATTDLTARELALYELRQLTDPRSIAALEDILTIDATFKQQLIRKLGKEEAQKFVVELNLAAITALGNMPQHVATVKLATCAVTSPWQEARQLAAELLRPRPKTDYVPMMMSALQAPIEADIDVHVTLNGDVHYTTELFQEGAEGDFARREGLSFLANPRNILRRIPTRFDLRTAARVSRAAAEQVAAANAAIQSRNVRIKEALKTAAGFELDIDASPEIYWQAWRDFNELTYSEEDEPVYETSQYYSFLPRMMSCFVAGTPVWTKGGPTPIERIKPGDMVLSQNPVTGELDYRPVLETTLRPPSPTVTLVMPEEEIATTLGHRFWLNGRGWEMAKFLEAGMPLHAVDRGVEIKSLANTYGEAEAHNLVVDDFHTYFVGKSRLLVHDNSCPRPTTGPIPGMTIERPADGRR